MAAHPAAVNRKFAIEKLCRSFACRGQISHVLYFACALYVDRLLVTVTMTFP
jgi:hypothetical protein